MPPPRTGTAYEKNGRWYIGIRLRDGRKWVTPCPPRADNTPLTQIHAKAVAADLQRAYDAGRWDPEAPAAAPMPTVEATPPLTVLAYAREWIKTQDYSTIQDDRNRIEFYLANADLGAMVLVEVRPRHVAAFVAALRSQASCRGGTLAPRSIRNIYSVVHRLFEHAVVAELIALTPCHLPRRTVPSPIDKEPGARSTWVFTRAEVEQFLADPRVLPDRRVLYAVLFLTGARYGEVAALRWRDWEKDLAPLGRISIARSMERATRKEKGTKTGVPRQVPVHPTLAVILAEWRKTGWASIYGRTPTDEDLLVPNRLMTARNVYADNPALKRDCTLLGLRYRSLHKTRRTLISLALDDGVRGEIFEWITHDASKRSMRNQYTTLAWATLCTEMVKVQIVGPRTEGLATGSATEEKADPDSDVIPTT